MSSSPPEGLTARRATEADAPAINVLVTAADEDIQGWSDSTESDLLDWWREVDLVQDSWLLEDATGELAGYGLLYRHGDLAQLDCFVDPARKGQGIGSWLLTRGEERARETGAPKTHAWCLEPDELAKRLFELIGYHEVRRYYRMLVDLEGPPPEPDWPDGLTVSTMNPDADARAFHATLNEAFAEEWNWVAMPFERWVEFRLKVPDFDPTLCFIVRDGDEIAAVLRAEPNRFASAWIGAVGVRKPWRKRGLGLALLYHTFGEFYRRGLTRIALGVDAQNPTGATRLYERAGMHVAYAAIAYEKELA
jgi:mycothiol synthase